jgi:SepF-like predicted cell division protein (DUF552 family)
MKNARVAMRETTVRNADGGIKLLHHATNKYFDPAEMAALSHFGSRAASKFRMLETREEDAVLVSGHLDVRNPLHISDIDDDHDFMTIAELIEDAHPGIVGDLWNEMVEHDPGTQSEYIVDLLRDAGYDGLSYTNAHEDPGSISLMILDPKQVHIRRVGPISESKDPWDLTVEEYTGPAIIMDVFGIDGDAEDYEHLYEALRDEGSELPVLARSQDGWEARWLDDWEPEATQGLFDPEGAVQGFYMGGQLWISEVARGAGRSSLMINAAADLLGGCPSLNSEGMGYSPSGHAAHCAAHREALTWKPRNEYACVSESHPEP